MAPLTYLSDQNILFCKGKEHLEAILPDMHRHLKKHGYCIVQMWDLTETPLLALRTRLGRGQRHIRADSNGIVPITPNVHPISNLDESHYFGSSSREHPPHTDGAYLNGFLQQGRVFKRIEPPAIVLLQCVRASRHGGTTILIDAQRVLRDLLTRHPSIAKILMSHGCVNFCRDDHMAVDLPVYERLSVERWRIRFRCDEALYPAEWATIAVQHLYDHYLTNDQYQQKIVLEEGQILVVDNFRVLHGREAFSVTLGQSRLFRRTWVQDDSNTQILHNFRHSSHNCRAFERHAVYASVTESTVQPSHLHLDLGIRLPSHLQVALEQPISRALPMAA
jgi:alpha-ketoglutarate-dependent taurine dioxygenase